MTSKSGMADACGLLGDLWRGMTWLGRIAVWPAVAAMVLVTALVFWAVGRLLFKGKSE